MGPTAEIRYLRSLGLYSTDVVYVDERGDSKAWSEGGTAAHKKQYASGVYAQASGQVPSRREVHTYLG